MLRLGFEALKGRFEAGQSVVERHGIGGKRSARDAWNIYAGPHGAIQKLAFLQPDDQANDTTAHLMGKPV